METTSKAMLQTMAEVDAFFYNNDVAPIVYLQQGMPATDSVVIARECGRRPASVLRTLDALIEEGTISLLQFKERDYLDDRGNIRRKIELTEAGAFIAMPYIGGRMARMGKVKMGSAFLSMHNALAEQQYGNWLRACGIARPNDLQQAAHPPPLAVID